MAIGDKKPVVMESDVGTAGGAAAYDATQAALAAKVNTYGKGVNLLDNWYFASPDAIVDQRQGYVVPPGVTYYYDGSGTVAGTTERYYPVAYIDADSNGVFHIGEALHWCSGASIVRGYIEVGYTIDRWFRVHGAPVLLEPSCLTLKNTVPDREFNFFQIIENPAPLIGKTLTLSCLATNNIFKTVTGTFAGSGNIGAQTVIGDEWYLQIWEDDGVLHPRIYTVKSGKEISIVAIKLELGTEQTLAHQDESGNWVLNDPPPNYAQELAKCQRYQLALEPYYGAGAAEFGGIHLGVNFPVEMCATPTMEPTTIKTQMSGAGGDGWYEGSVTASFKWGGKTSCTILLTNPDQNKFPQDYPVTARIDTKLLFDANL